jgi:hypothetical protein
MPLDVIPFFTQEVSNMLEEVGVTELDGAIWGFFMGIR